MSNILGNQKRSRRFRRHKNEVREAKECIDCKIIKPISDYSSSGGSNYRSYCKACDNIRRLAAYHEKKVKKKLGFASLPDKVQQEILALMAIKKKEEGYLTVKAIAAKYDINYPRLLSWKLRKK